MSEQNPSSTAKPLLSRRWVLGLAALGAVGAVFAMTGRQSDPLPEDATLTVEQAHRMAQLGDITLIDIRTPREWRATGVPRGAVAIDMRRRDFVDQLNAAVAENPALPVALICARGVRSARLARALARAGFTNIKDVPEGMLGSTAGPGWLARGLPVVAFEEND